MAPLRPEQIDEFLAKCSNRVRRRPGTLCGSFQYDRWSRDEEND